MIHDDLIVYRPPSKGQIPSACHSEDCYSWDLRLVNYRYARLCSIIVKTLYSHASLKMIPSESTASIKRLSTMLNAWRLSIPAKFRPNSEVNLTEQPTLPQGTCIQSDLGLKHAEASLAIRRWAIIGVRVDQILLQTILPVETNASQRLKQFSFRHKPFGFMTPRPTGMFSWSW